MSIEEIKLRMKLLSTEDDFDTEMVHIDADYLLCELLLELGHKDIVEDFRALKKWYA